jgi:hypothetical protein
MQNMTNKADKPVLAVVNSAKKPKADKRNGSGNGSGGGTGKSKNKKFGEYEIINGSFYQIKAVRSGADDRGFVEIPLCDFTCKIIEEVTHDTGLEDQAFLRVEGVRNDGLILPTVEVPSSKFYSTQANWINEFFGTSAFVYPGNSKRDNLRAAIHLYSKLEGDIPKRHVYQYVGWQKINGQWYYLSGSGAITSNGLDEAVQVDLGSGHMSRYSLPTPINNEQLKPLASLVLDLLEICPSKQHIGAALLSSIARAPLGECYPTDFALFVHGLTGSMKSAISAIPLAFFGDFNARRFPANFSDTANDTEMKGYQAKDSVFVLDDFKPSVSLAEASKIHAKAERFIRNTGNQAGRGRRGADMQAKAAPFNRSMTIITGEDLPKGQSLLGRLLILELSRADVNTTILTKLQHASELGQLSMIMSTYLQWLAPRMDGFKKELPKMVTALRDVAIRDRIAPSHPRAPEIFANLVAGMEIFIDFMIDSDLLTIEQSNIVLSDIEEHLKDAFSEQGAYQVEQDETVRFLELLRAAFASGNAHIASRLKQAPPLKRPYSWGWRSNEVDLTGQKIYKPMGDCIGWLCEEKRELLIEQNAAFKVVQQFAKTQGDAFLLSASSLWRRMGEKGMILAAEKRANGTKKLSVKRQIGGVSKRVMILSADLVESEEEKV